MSKPKLTVSQQVLVWAQGQLGKRIGKGECWDLAERALDHAGAQTSNDLGPVEEDTDYVWGDPVDDVKDVEPGFILQLRDHVVTTITHTKYTFSDGSWEESTNTETIERPHHTAIVSGKLDASGAVRTLEQNVEPGGKVVQNKTLNTRDVAAVTKTSMGQHMNPNTKKMQRATVTRTVTVTVTGSIWVYKPKGK